MRFSAALTPPPVDTQGPVDRQRVAQERTDSAPQVIASSAPVADVPADLDQRVRESGEW